jgi:hypothetical protein
LHATEGGKNWIGKAFGDGPINQSMQASSQREKEEKKIKKSSSMASG